MPISADPRIGSDLVGYRVEGLLGRGGMGVVYRAYDARLKRFVALKLVAPELSQDNSFRKRFLSETEVAASLEHPNVVPIHDAGEADGQLFLVMRYVEGSDLKARLRLGRGLGPSGAIAICAQIAAALDAAHASGLVHRDVKPSNVLLDRRDHVYLADFGLSRRLADQGIAGEHGLSLGTPAYIAPEQVRGEPVDARADVYALGCVLYECLTGGQPFQGESQIAVVYAHLVEPPPKASSGRPELGDGIDGVIAKALAKSPGERYATCEDLVEAARAELGLAAEGARPVARRRVRFVAPVAAAVTLAAALLVLFLTRGTSGPAPLAGRLARIDPATNRVTQTLSIRDPLSAVAAGAAGVWAASVRDDALWRIDPETAGVTKIASVGAPQDVAVSGDKAYAVAEGPKFGAGNVTVFGAATGNRIDGVELIALRLAAGADGVWAGGWLDVKRLGSGAPLAVRATVPIPIRVPLDAAHDREQLDDLALGDGSLWVIGDARDRRLWRIDVRSQRIVETIELPFPPARLALGAGDVWVTDQLGDAVARIDPTLGRIVAMIPVGRGAGGIAFGAGSIWTTSFIDGTVSRIDPRTNRVTAKIDVGGSPRDVAVASGSVWTAGDAS